MPVNVTLMRRLKRKYGKKKGERIYYAMEAEGHPATKPAAVRKSRRKKSRKRRRRKTKRR